MRTLSIEDTDSHNWCSLKVSVKDEAPWQIWQMASVSSCMLLFMQANWLSVSFLQSGTSGTNQCLEDCVIDHSSVFMRHVGARLPAMVRTKNVSALG